VTDRYARLNHGYSDEKECSFYAIEDKPAACLAGSGDAQNAAAFASLVSNGLTFLTSSLIGSLSDEHGRRGILIIGIFLATFSPFCLVLLQINEHMSPTWYYAAGSITGFVNWIAVALSALSDVMPSQWRAPSFGLLLAGFSLGFAFAPLLALAFDHFQVSVLALTLVFTGFVTTLIFFPETLPSEAAAEAAQSRAAQYTQRTCTGKIVWGALRPLRELSILNRNRLFRMLSLLAFFSGMVSSADQTLLLYYCEERLAFNDHDVAIMFMLIGILGIIVQGVFLKPFNDCLGERLVIVVAFFLGAVDNFLYGMAKNKATIFIAVSISSFLGMSFPTISAIKSNNVVR
jgi:DHA1 family tetracycline resistance protein-like MFS transporter